MSAEDNQESQQQEMVQIPREILERILAEPGRTKGMVVAQRDLETVLRESPRRNLKADSNLPVSSLGLTPRTAKTLEREGIKTLSELLNHRDFDLLKIPGLGKAGLLDIEKMAHQYGGLSVIGIARDRTDGE